MRCKQCDYPLWNLTQRLCPECGAPFTPSDFRLVPNSCRFLCPHCKQDYYGTDENGHLVPRTFECVKCHRSIDMDEMVLLPTEGVREERTTQDLHPWVHRRSKGFLKGLLTSIGWALVQPIRLMRADPGPSVGQAWLFLAITALLYALPSLLFFALMVIVPGGGVGAGYGVILFFVSAVAVPFVLALLWGAVAHLLLRVTGPTAGGMDWTYQTICYSHGATVLNLVPCLSWATWFLSGIWWAISATLMLKERQQVSAGRAVLAGVAPPAVVLLLAVGGLVGVLVYGVSASRTASLQQGGTNAQAVTKAVVDYAAASGGTGPTHPIELVEAGHMTNLDFEYGVSATQPMHIPVGQTTLMAWASQPQAQQQTALQQAVDGVPKDTVALRFGDFVFTHYGIDVGADDPGLWIVIGSRDPFTNKSMMMIGSTGLVHVGALDGSLVEIPKEDFATALEQQNALRADHGLAPLPDPDSVPQGVAVGPE